ncbi:MAG: tetratricopeptide repeat protein [Motiliproteus sp.]
MKTKTPNNVNHIITTLSGCLLAMALQSTAAQAASTETARESSAVLTVQSQSVSAAHQKDSANVVITLRQELQQQWALIKYQQSEDQREAALERLSKQANEAVSQHPQSSELLIWQGIILSSLAGETGGLGALSLVDQARESFERSLALDPKALSGSAYTSLGALYYQVPGWPLSFGSDKKARQMLQQALQIDPDGIDSNYFYADFLVSQKEYRQARTVLDKALMATARPERPVADAGRRDEITQLLNRIADKDKDV